MVEPRWDGRRPRPDRPAGPIDLNRYELEPYYAGVQTFMKLPMCFDQDDLRAGDVDVAVCGVPFEMVGTRGGTALGPRAIRSCDYLPTPPLERPHLSVRVDPLDVLNVVDYGDAPVTPFFLDQTHAAVRAFVREIVEADAIPIILGGDHSVTWPNVAAMADVYGPDKVGVLHFDAHADTAPEMFGALAGHGSPIRRLIEDAHIPGKNFVQVGLRGYWPGPEILDWMKAQGIKSHFMVEIDRAGFDVVMDRAIDQALDGPEYLFISLDIDVMDPSVAPGTASPEPGGMMSDQLLPMMRRVAHEVGICGIDVTEVSPPFDAGAGITAILANRAITEALTGLAMRRLDIAGPDYVHPDASG